MDSHIKALGHPVHPMLVAFPLGLLTTAVIFDVVQKATDDVRYAETAFFLIVIGLAVGALAALAGLVDFVAIPAGTRAKRIGAVHGAGNALIVVLFMIALVLRIGADNHVANGLVLGLQVVAIALSFVTGWLGGELVQRLGVAVADDAGIDAPARLEARLRLGAADSPLPIRGGMESRTKMGGHAVHPMLIAYPLSLFPAALIFDALHGATDDPRYGYAAFFAIAAGVIGGILAAVPGVIDWLAVPSGSRAKRIGWLHLLVNLTMVALFALSWLLRSNANDRQPTTAAVAVAIIALVGSFVGGWLGGELHERLGVGVDTGAQLDATSSLRQRSVDPYPSDPTTSRRSRTRTDADRP
jgi:uncharacterized membrane protein